MSKLSDYKRIVSGPLERALRDEARQLRTQAMTLWQMVDRAETALRLAAVHYQQIEKCRTAADEPLPLVAAAHAEVERTLCAIASLHSTAIAATDPAQAARLVTTASDA